jgi:hypothetical protein
MAGVRFDGDFPVTALCLENPGEGDEIFVDGRSPELAGRESKTSRSITRGAR